MKPQIYKLGPTWILWVPGVRVYRFDNWESAVERALDIEHHQTKRKSTAVRG